MRSRKAVVGALFTAAASVFALGVVPASAQPQTTFDLGGRQSFASGRIGWFAEAVQIQVTLTDTDGGEAPCTEIYFAVFGQFDNLLRDDQRDTCGTATFTVNIPSGGVDGGISRVLVGLTVGSDRDVNPDDGGVVVLVADCTSSGCTLVGSDSAQEGN